MRDESFFLGRPIYSLQTMLRELSFAYPEIPRVIPDGFFGEDTLEAVMVFQRDFFPPVTGVVNNGTWDAIVELYRTVLFRNGSPSPLRLWPDRGMVVYPEQSEPQLFVVQGMFTALAKVLEEFEATEFSGTHEGATVRNTKRVQKLGGLPENGVLDRPTLDLLTRLYHTFLSRTAAAA